MNPRRLTGPKGGRTLPLITIVSIVAYLLVLQASAQSGPDVPAPAVRIEPTAIFPDGHSFHLEIARTPEERARGYMFRDRVGSTEGMLFLFSKDEFHSFWMKNCRVPLDLIWLSADLRVVHLEKKVPPCRLDPCPSYPPMRKARFVLEVRAGMAEKSGLQVGDSIRVEGVDLSAPISP